MKLIKIFLLLLVGVTLQAQNKELQDQEASPKNGINQLAIEFYGIEFTKEQRTLIAGKEIEYIFQIAQDGKPIPSKLNGVSDTVIINKFYQKAQVLADFNPRIIDGKPIDCIYFLTIEFPSYKMTERRVGLMQASLYNAASIADFEYIEKSKTRYDLLIGGMSNQLIGNPSEHLGIGGGMRIDLSYTNKKSYLFGLNMNIYGNKLKKYYPINTTREQFSSPPTLLIGAIVGKWLNKINIQGELNIAVQNITEKIGDNDPDWIQLKGWSPGIVVNYPIKFGKDNPIYYYGMPSLFNNHINLHIGIRYLDLSIKEASGFMTEIGISYRMSMLGIKRYKFKEQYLGN